MLAARDQENLVHNQQTLAASKPANQGLRQAAPKTPGAKYPKTPLKIPLHDENAPVGLGGKSVLATKGKGLENLATGGKKNTTFDKNAFVTPLGPQNRAPLGMKTTNAKARVYQTPAGPALDKDFDNVLTQKPTSTRRMRQKVSTADTIKIDVHNDQFIPLEEREVEYAPPKPKERPYESEDFPADTLNMDVLKGENLTRGWQQIYINPVDENGVTRKEREFEENKARAMKAADEKILRAIEETDWSVSDVPSTKAPTAKIVKEQEPSNPATTTKTTARNGPGTVTSRKAASMFSAAPRSRPIVAAKKPAMTAAPRTQPSFLQRKRTTPVPINTSEMRHTAAAAASRSTLGYTKGRTASGVMHSTAARSTISASTTSTASTATAPRIARTGLPRSTSQSSTSSDKTITPARYAQSQAPDFDSEDLSRLDFLSIFDRDNEDADLSLKGGLPDCLKGDEDSDEEFVMTLGE